MKIICDCGNEMEFKIDNEDIYESSIEENGDYCKLEHSKFDFWSEHDEAGMTCKKCGKSIWYFS